MNKKNLTERQVEILKSLEEKVEAKDMRLLEAIIEGSLPDRDIDAVCQLINNEHLMYGINKSYEPNDYGRELENLIDVVNRSRINVTPAG